jgi:long-chain acyl-CoA synthetase
MTAVRYHDGAQWQSITWGEWTRTSTRLAAALVAKGLQPGDRVAIIGRPCLGWLLADMAIWKARCTSVPVHQSALPGQTAYILNDADVRFAFVEDPAQLEKLASVRDRLPDLQHVIVMDPIAHLEETDARGRDVVRLLDLPASVKKGDWYSELETLNQTGARLLAQEPNRTLQLSASVADDDLATIIYTSGTSGRPRGVAFTHDSLVAQMNATMLAAELTPADTTILFLPLSFAFGRIIYLASVQAGATLAIGRGPSRLLDDMAEIRPTFFIAVPYVLERIHQRFRSQVLENSMGPARAIAQAQFAGAPALAERVANGESLSLLERTKEAVVNRTLWAAFRRIFGGRLRYIICGGAPLSRSVAWFYHGAGVLVLEGYGLTETCGPVATNRPDDYRFGSVGLPLGDCELRIADDGEVLVRGRMVMQCYWKDEEATANALQGGWLHTGDLGEFSGAHLTITGRKKETIVTATGRSIAPAPLESRLGEISLIAHAVIHGDDRPHLVALVTLDTDALIQWARTNGMGNRTVEELRSDQKVYDWVKNEIDAVNRDVNPAEAIRRFAILHEDFRPASGELTASWKTRRRFILEKYRPMLDDLYDAALSIER